MNRHIPLGRPIVFSTGVNIFLSYIVLLIVLVEQIPPAGNALPLMGKCRDL